MKPINILFDGIYNDVDIILVPDWIANAIDQVVLDFHSWLSIPENKSRFMKPNERWGQVLMIDTQEFVWWLNNVKILSQEKSMVVKQHTSYIEEYPTAHF